MKQAKPQEKVYGSGAVRYTLPKGPGGPVNLNIDFADAPVPANYYYASTVCLKRDQSLGMIALLFGRGGKDFPGNAVTMVVPEGALLRNFWKSTRQVEEVLDLQLKDLQQQPGEQVWDSENYFAQTLYANCLFASVGVGESCIDFYYLPPRDLHLARTRGRDISLNPVLRIVASNVLMKRFFNLCRPLAEAQPSVVAVAPANESEHQVRKKKVQHARNRA